MPNLIDFGATIVAAFTGEIMGMQTDLTTIEVEIGAAIDAISGDIPGRKITTSLVGEAAFTMKFAYPQDPTHAVSAIRRYDESSDSATSQKQP